LIAPRATASSAEADSVLVAVKYRSRSTGKFSLPRNAIQFQQADRAEFRTAHAEVAQAKGDIRVVRVDLGQEPGAARIGREQLHHGHQVGLWLTALAALLVQAAIAD